MDYFKLCKLVLVAIQAYRKTNRKEPTEIYLHPKEYYLLENIETIKNPKFFSLNVHCSTEVKEGFTWLWTDTKYSTEIVLNS